jgi:ADP-heptose:LPS heptosyltransferase
MENTEGQVPHFEQVDSSAAAPRSAAAKLQTITNLRWALVPYTAGSGLHVGCGAQRLLPNAIGIDTGKGGAVDLLMKLDRFPLFAGACQKCGHGDGVFDFVIVGSVMKRVAAPRKMLADAWRVLGENGYLILVQPTLGARSWVLEDAPDYLVHPHMVFDKGPLRVDVIQKLAKGEGRQILPAPAPEKTCAVVRTGGLGDALWAASILPALKAQGYHVTLYTESAGEQVLRHDPHIDQMFVTDELRTPNPELGAFWAHEQNRYDRWINLVECVEKNAVAVCTDMRFYWPDEERRRIFNRNYLEAVHDLAGVQRKWAQKFYATDAELAWALNERAGAGKVAVIAPSGSTLPKFWPYLNELADGLLARGYRCWVLGDLRTQHMPPRKGLEVIGMGWSVREAFAFAQVADLVVGQDTGITNAVAFEPMRKVVLLTHLTAQNLTRDWKNTVALHGTASCWPCHRIHYLQNGWSHCNFDETTQGAKCQAEISAEQVLTAVDRAIVLKQVAA